MDKQLQDMTVDELLAIRTPCDVCIGFSPLWHGHDRNPPCVGAAKEEILGRARRWDGPNGG
jgi:hypothetical protein